MKRTRDNRPRRKDRDARHLQVERAIRERQLADAPKTPPGPIRTDGRTYRAAPFEDREHKR